MARVVIGRSRCRRPRVEVLEGRALLSALAMTLTTDKAVYQAGDPITMTFTETNDSSQPVDTVGVAPNDGFDVAENGKVVWESNAGAVPMVISMITLQPGQSHTLTATWDGVPSTGGPPVLAGGSFTVTNGLDPKGASASFQIESPLSYSITTDKADYSVGQPIQITYTETNTSRGPLTVNTGLSGFDITQYQTPVATVSGTDGSSPGTKTLQPGESITQTATWNGMSNMGSLQGTDPWGSFTVSGPNAPQGLTAVFQIENPTTTNLTALSAELCRRPAGHAHFYGNERQQRACERA